MSSFSEPPNKSVDLKPYRFNMDISNEAIRDLKTLLSLSPLPPVTFENSLDDRKYGITREWLVRTRDYWQDKFDWKQHEAHINTFPNFKLPIKDDDGNDYDIHFVALFSRKPDAVPLLFLHGWPGSFLEFLPILDILRERYSPETLPYHVICPSMPGYGFSTPPRTNRDFALEDIARMFDRLMGQLGFGAGYIVQGGDIGSKVGRVITATYDAAKALHINFCIMPEPENPIGDMNEAERKGLERTHDFKTFNSSYALQHATKPSTIGAALSASPLALLAWVGEKFLDWTDDDLPVEQLLEDVSLYWFTNCIATSLYPYRHLFTPGVIGAHENPKNYVNKPLGYSWFPQELAPIPRSWAATTGNLVFYRQHDKGGHFAALEQPDVLLKDVEDFVAQVWKK
ncbi:hypothetical protein H2200_000585 [Cladophialophora chaetospira]|uniref:Epoxide hydrolase N-terminal domain-containing protein n=1 Tax=Cladophialophora chaetospira TaxID=386627 RepID=A0AA38XNQ1_9EURO|nr:hypothetical protein H2200_000585 [Cladophialophora chaetospira]